MDWWQWVVFGLLLLSAEMIVDAEFYLVFIGVSAVATGLIGLAPISVPIWGQWLLFAALVVASVLLFRRSVYEKIRGNTPDIAEGVSGEVVIAEDEIAPGASGRVQLRGATWTARNVGDAAILAGGRARVESAEGLVVNVRSEGPAS